MNALLTVLIQGLFMVSLWVCCWLLFRSLTND